MTCVVALEHEGTVWMASDSIAIDGLQACTILDPKVFIRQGIGFGFCGSFRAGQLLKYALEVPEHLPEKSDMEYLVVDLIDALRDLWRSKGVLKSENDVQDVELQCLIAYRGKLYYIDEDLQIGRPSCGYLAIGCGSDVALGALHALHRSGIEPARELERALDASVAWCAGVRAPFTIISVPGLNAAKKQRTKK